LQCIGEIVRLSPQFCKVAATPDSAPISDRCVVSRGSPPASQALIRIGRALLWADCVVNPAGWWLLLSNVVLGCLTATHASSNQNTATLPFGFDSPSPRSRETRTNTATCVIQRASRCGGSSAQRTCAAWSYFWSQASAALIGQPHPDCASHLISHRTDSSAYITSRILVAARRPSSASSSAPC
jgi:hypothetical protein